MAANYWVSTQRKHWQFNREQLTEHRRQLEEEEPNLVQQYPLPERRLLSIYFHTQVTKLGKKLGVRQQVLATAQIYVRRFYTKVEVRRTNPYLVLATALYLACKVEECPQHIRLVAGEARQSWPDLIVSDISKLGECEFLLISEMSSQLIVHHPYRSLAELQVTFSMTQEETSLAWSIINDHYLTDLPLLYPPHTIAITAVFLAIILRPSQSSLQAHAAATSATSMISAVQTLNTSAAAGAAISGPQSKVQKLISWLAESAVDIAVLVDCTQEMISLYQVWDEFNEKVSKEQISRFVKARGLDK